ncbi:metal dependent phosphohydrolase [Geoalkalibacter ferrihydriticus]|uniref:Ribonuclease Y n=2 Tax=Geoalkalibacter ferrihydriticus TaxID=392333 RepID=A0A0C2HJ20_9BACT|nr:ribonuclease Y [Geoalkalibacter ferrihydriticus]KIH77051.1 ribonuclease [Geoalkalibacter ferrihydriticus DSM 17813]SDL37265.1 metal dependent phosphohydrolase [Geoalkalibacter ferrihydriticus]
MTIELAIILIVAALAAGVFVGILLRRKFTEGRLADAQKAASQLIEDAQKDADAIRKEASLEAKDLILQAKTESEQEARDLRRDIQSQEKRLLQKEEHLDRKVSQLDGREEDLGNREKKLEQMQDQLLQREKSVDALVQEQTDTLERISGMSPEEAKQYLMQSMESEARHDAAKMIKQIEEEAREKADKKAKEILSLAIQRYAGDYVAEKTVSVVPLPTDEMKGRIIGREGRNIRAIEAATGIDLIIDDTPEAVIISGFNPVRREVARLSLERLIADGRIHPARIEEVVQKAEQDVDTTIREAGEQATFDVGVHGIHPEIIKLIGRLKYRTSYGQNVLQHSLEVAFLCGIMASELGINVKQAKRAGLLHDIGKAVDHEVEGSHAVIGADLARKYGESPKIVHALAAHHEDEKPETVLAILVQAADALSGARPGARRETLETYVKRLGDLERIGHSFGGVSSCFAIQAGREIRVMVSSDSVTDAQSFVLAKDIAKKIENEMTYPGQIKVNVIRETRATEFAR